MLESGLVDGFRSGGFLAGRRAVTGRQRYQMRWCGEEEVVVVMMKRVAPLMSPVEKDKRAGRTRSRSALR